MPATALAAAAPTAMVLFGEDEVTFGRVVEIAGLQRLLNGGGHGEIKGKTGIAGRTPDGICRLSEAAFSPDRCLIFSPGALRRPHGPKSRNFVPLSFYSALYYALL